jgi:signal transduction histidine kinase/PAS domain-containing protein
VLNLDTAVRQREELGSAIMEAAGYRVGAAGIFDAVNRYWFENKKPLILLVPKLDVLRHALVQEFLQGVRTRVEARQMVVLLGGDQNFREFVYGENSDFNCATQVVIQGFDRAEFDVLTEQYRSLVSFDIPEATVQTLWEMTSGQAPLLRPLISRAVEQRARSLRPKAVPLTPDEARSLPDLLTVSSATSRGMYGRALETIWNFPECRFGMEDLLRVGSSEAPLEPGALELGGVAVRQDGRLQFGSPLAATFFKTHFTPRRRADLFAVAGDWVEAFKQYRGLDEEEWVRPDSAVDRSEVDRVLQSLASLIAATPSEGQAYLLFRNAVRCVLGFDEVTWWRWNRGWEMIREKTVDQDGDPGLFPAACLPEEHIYAFSQVLPSDPENGFYWIDLPAPWSRIALAAALEVPGSDRPEILAVSDAGRNRSISQDRLRMARTLMAAFLSGFGRARRGNFFKRQIDLHGRRMAVFDAILESIDGLEMDRKVVCRHVARALRRLGYRRVLICLVDAKRERIQGICDDSDQPQYDVARMTDYPLTHTNDVQPVVIVSRAPFVTSDASREPLANREVVAAVGLTAMAVIPMIDADETAVGTIHVERDDGQQPSALEIEELARFGKRLALALAHGERTTLIDQALDRIPDPVAIADPSLRWRYANTPAKEMLDIPKGWRRWGHARTIADGAQKHIKHHLVRSLASPPKEDLLVAKQVTSFCSEGDHYHLSTAPLRDAGGGVVGAVLTLREFTRVNTLVAMLGKIIGAGNVDAALRALLDAMRDLGHDKTRLYLLREVGGEERLVSHLAIGQSPSELAVFNSGNVLLVARRPNHHTWACIDSRQGKVFTWRPNGNEGEIIQSKSGLDVVVVTDPDQAHKVGKCPGDFWLDLPLLAENGRPLGKLATHIDEHLDPQQFWVLQILAALAAVVIETFRTHEQQQEEREKWEDEGYRKSLATIAHHLLNRVIALDGIHYQYLKAENDPGRLPSLNRSFGILLKIITATVKRARDFLLPPQAEFRDVDLSTLCGEVVSSHFITPTVQAEYRGVPGLHASADPELLSLALAEALDNARKAVAATPVPRVSIELAAAGNCAAISVHDNGCGIDAKEREEVFDDFATAWPAGVNRSTGLGLGWIRRVLRAHGGDVRIVESVFGSGVCFVLTIPLAQKESEYE